MPHRDVLVDTLRTETGRLVDLLAGAETLDRRVPGLDWTVAQVAAHLFTVYGVFAAALRGVDVSSLFAETGEHATLADHVARVNADAIARIEFDSPAHAAAELGAAASGLLHAIVAVADLEATLPTPWYGTAVTHRASTIVSLAGSETLVHTRDIARGLGVRWRLSAASAGVIAPTVMRETLPYLLDAKAAAGVRVTYDVHLRGAGALRVRVAGGVATTGPVDGDTTGVDCVLSLAPDAALLVGFRRRSVWRAVATGQSFASGRRPWWGPRFPGLFLHP
jgi:hypothetical protein